MEVPVELCMACDEPEKERRSRTRDCVGVLQEVAREVREASRVLETRRRVVLAGDCLPTVALLHLPFDDEDEGIGGR